MISNDPYDPKKLASSILSDKAISDANSPDLGVDLSNIFNIGSDNDAEQSLALLKEAKVEVIDTRGLDPTFIPLREGSLPVVVTDKFFESKETPLIQNEILDKIGNKSPIDIVSFLNRLKDSPPEDYKNYFAHVNKNVVNDTLHCELVDFDRIFNQIDKEPIDLNNVIGITDKLDNHTVFQPEFFNLLKENNFKLEYSEHPENHEENKNFKIDFSDPNHTIDIATHDSWVNFSEGIKVIKNEIFEKSNPINKKQNNPIIQEKQIENNPLDERPEIKSEPQEKRKTKTQNDKQKLSSQRNQIVESNAKHFQDQEYKTEQAKEKKIAQEMDKKADNMKAQDQTYGNKQQEIEENDRLMGG